eukprot:TRINITY_DN1384_c0_g1_i1.p1 TRINITY_DN1384_c0_g1~~TRINITY_DN1384_c0_g1_i1.p1  ORF type:complete len:242 (-),score=47.54 TRINITY_DN1384_c0_g1_i1:281-1006(-)
MNLIVFVFASFAAISTVVALPALNVGRCPGNVGPPPEKDWAVLGLANVTGFTLDDGSGPGKQKTTMWTCYSTDFLYVKYLLADNNIYNPIRGCNAKLYEADVVEMFIAAGTDVPHVYLELEVSPYSDLFASRLVNPNLTCAGIQDDLINCNATGITWEARIHHDGFWWAYLQVPWTLINSMSRTRQYRPTAGPGDVYRANFFRVDTPANTNDTFEYSCWSPTMAVPPCFHKPAYFGTLNLV